MGEESGVGVCGRTAEGDGKGLRPALEVFRVGSGAVRVLQYVACISMMGRVFSMSTYNPLPALLHVNESQRELWLCL